MFYPQHKHRLSKDGKNSEPRGAPNRPKIDPDMEGILKGELVEVFAVDRTKLLTAEQQKVIWKKEEKTRDAERKMEKQHEVDEDDKRKALEELYANVTQQKIEAKKEEVQAKKLADIQAKIEKRRAAAEAETAATSAANKVRVSIKRESGSHDPNDPNDLLGEDEVDPQRKTSSFGPKKYPNKFGPPVYPNTELPGEYGDAEWDDAEEYGYSSKFPYQKKEKIVHKGKKSLPPYVAPESAGSDEQRNLGKKEKVIKKVNDEMSTDESDGSSSGEVPVGGKLTTDNLMGYEKGLHHVDKAATSLALLLGKIMSEHPYSTRTPTNTAVGGRGYHYRGESDMNVNVETDVKELTSPTQDRPPMVNQYTQVWARDILEAMESAYGNLTGEREGEENKDADGERIPVEQDEIKVERKGSQRRDAMTLTRPAGYKELELSIPGESLTFEAQTQVKDHEIDQDYAMERGIILPKDNILWPTVKEFDIETASKRIQDYIEQCWTMDSKWQHHIHPIETISDDYRKRFVFEVKFSVPTPQHPIPVATASVFFIFEISHYAPKDDFVKVHYVVEGTRFVHSPGTLDFQDKWLWSIISDKIKVQRSIDF